MSDKTQQWIDEQLKDLSVEELTERRDAVTKLLDAKKQEADSSETNQSSGENTEETLNLAD